MAMSAGQLLTVGRFQYARRPVLGENILIVFDSYPVHQTLPSESTAIPRGWLGGHGASQVVKVLVEGSSLPILSSERAVIQIMPSVWRAIPVGVKAPGRDHSVIHGRSQRSLNRPNLDDEHAKEQEKDQGNPAKPEIHTESPNSCPIYPIYMLT
jgi:hypothetical protein